MSHATQTQEKIKEVEDRAKWLAEQKQIVAAREGQLRELSVSTSLPPSAQVECV